MSDNFMKRWLTITLLIPQSLEEVVSNFLMEQGATGIEEVDEDLRWKRLRTYFSQDGKEKGVPRLLRRYLKSLQNVDPEIANAKIEVTSIPEQDWGENWKRFFKPVQVTSRLVVKPPWSKIRLKKNQIPISIHPGMAFGTGTHATTKLCMKALEGGLRRKGLSVLDVGTGSGILSIAAAQLGAGEVWGFDTDGVAVEDARENVKRNGVSHIVKIRKGRIGDIQKRFDVIVANIDLKNLKRMRWPLAHHLKSQGLLILSGILEGDGERVRQHFLETERFQWARITHEEEWVSIVLKKKRIIS
jgi:ribosomal protein L11 methyltransferase